MDISLTNEQAVAVLRALDIAAQHALQAAEDAASGRLPSRGAEDLGLSLEQYFSLQQSARHEVQTFHFLSEIFRRAQEGLPAIAPEAGT